MKALTHRKRNKAAITQFIYLFETFKTASAGVVACCTWSPLCYCPTPNMPCPIYNWRTFIVVNWQISLIFPIENDKKIPSPPLNFYYKHSLVLLPWLRPYEVHRTLDRGSQGMQNIKRGCNQQSTFKENNVIEGLSTANIWWNWWRF